MKTKEKFSKYTIQSRSDLKKILIKEKKKYMEYIYPSVKNIFQVHLSQKVL